MDEGNNSCVVFKQVKQQISGQLAFPRLYRIFFYVSVVTFTELIMFILLTAVLNTFPALINGFEFKSMAMHPSCMSS